MGSYHSSGSIFGKKRLNMYLHYFALFLLVLTVNGAPKPNPKPNPKADPKAKAQMAIIFNNNKHGDTGMSYREYGEYYSYGQESGSNRLNLGIHGGPWGTVGSNHNSGTVGGNQGGGGGGGLGGGWYPFSNQGSRHHWGQRRPQFSYFG